MTKIKRLVAVALAFLMIFGSVSIIGSAWDATVDDGFELDVTTKIFRQVDGEWIETSMVKAGEAVKARVYLNTNFFSSGGDLLFFYNNNFFEDAYTGSEQTLTINPAFYAGDKYGIEGYFFNSKSNSQVEERLVKSGAIDQAFADAHNFFVANISLDSNTKNKLFVGSEWLCEFDLTVKADATGTGDLFAKKETFKSTTAKSNYFNVFKGPSFGYGEDIVDMDQWDAVVTVSSNPVSLYNNYVEATFNTNGGAFEDGTTEKIITGEAGSAIDLDKPVYEGYIFEGWVAEGTTDIIADVSVLPFASVTYNAQWKSATDRYENELKFKTDIYRLDEATGEWVYTEKVIPGETVKARLYIDTNYYTNAGDILVFYDNDFFEETDPDFAAGSYTDVTFNTSETSSAGKLATDGTYALVASDARVIKRLVEAGHITQEFADTHTAYLATYKFNPSTSDKLSGAEYFAEWTLKVKDSATGEGDFFVVNETIQNASEAGQKAYINVPLSVENGTDDDSISLFEVNITTATESHPVSTISRINFDANGGAFATGETTFVIEGDIEDAVDATAIPEVTYTGYTFKGWVPADIAAPTIEDVVEVPAEIPFDELFLKALWIQDVEITIDPGNGDAPITETVAAGDPFDKPADPTLEGNYLAGWDANGEYIPALPDVYPDEDTTYKAIFEPRTYMAEYFVLNPETLVFDRVDTVSVTYGDEILAVPPSYTVPEGHVLTPAYKDVTFAADSMLAEGEKMPANGIKLYYKAVPSEYPAVFKLDGGNIGGETADVVINTVYGQQIKTPADPVKEGNTFTGWDPMVGNMYSEGAEFVATWEVNNYIATYIVEGEVYGTYDIPFGNEMEYPLAPKIPGYNFVSWDPALPATMPAEDKVFTAVYEKKDITITLDLADGTYDGDAADIVIEGKYGDAITAPDADLMEKEGYVFGGWSPVLPGTLPTEDTTYTAIWNPADDTPYEVWVYLMDTEGDYPAEDAPSQVIPMTGETDSAVKVAVPVPYGFKVNETKGDYGKEVLIAANGSTVYKVYFDREAYTIKFNGNEGMIGGTIVDGAVEGGEATVTDDYLYLSSVTAPADPVRVGYTFAGWAPSVDSEATKAVEYVAQWTVNSYDIIFMLKGNEGEADSEYDRLTFSFDKDVAVDSMAKPEKYGYDFVTWVDADGKTYKFPAKMPANDITVYAKFAPNTYEAKFFENAGDANAYDITEAEFDGAITAPASEPTKSGYEFGGWSLDGANALDFAGGNVIMDEKGKEFIAVWIGLDSTYVVEHYYMGTDGKYSETASESDPAQTAAIGSTVKATPKTVENFVFDEAAEGNVLEGIIAENGITVLKVYYSREKNNLTLNIDGTETDTPYFFEEVVNTVADPQKDGYKFTGWVDENGETATIPATMPGEPVYREATFEALPFVLDYQVDGVSVNGYPANVKCDDPLTAPAEADEPTKEGYVFDGWFTTEGIENTEYDKMPAGILTFTAKFSPRTDAKYALEIYKMTTDGTAYVKDTTITFNNGVVGEAIDFTGKVEVPEGFTLNEEMSKDTLKGEIPESFAAEDMLVLKAYLDRIQYTLYIDIDGNQTSEYYYYEQAIADRAEPTKKGYVFTGWTPDMPKNMPAEDVTVTATFDKDSYPATFDANGGAFADGETVKSFDIPYGEAVTAPTGEMILEGYTFKGWSLDKVNVIPNLGNMTDSGKTYYAVWEKAVITVTFYNYLPSDKGPAVPEGQLTYVYDQKADYLYGDTIVFPEDPTIQGHETHYVFTGWVDANGNKVEAGATVPAENFEIYASYERVKVMLIPKNDTCTTVIDRAGLTVDDYADGSEWFVYGLREILSKKVLLDQYIDVQGDGYIVVKKINDNSNYYGTGSIIEVYDNVTGELVESFRIIIFGDVNGDSYANGLDLSIVSEEVLGVTGWAIKGDPEYCFYNAKAGDLKVGSGVNGQDKALLNQHILSIGEINQVTGLVE